MAKFIEKPVVIEAVQLVNTYKSIGGALDFMNIPHRGSTVQVEKFHMYCDTLEGGLIITTLEGCHLASWGDMIIKGVHGEFYPCKPDIFKKTYFTEKEYAEYSCLEVTVKRLEKQNRRLEEIIERGLGPEDLKQDI